MADNHSISRNQLVRHQQEESSRRREKFIRCRNNSLEALRVALDRVSTLARHTSVLFEGGERTEFITISRKTADFKAFIEWLYYDYNSRDFSGASSDDNVI